MARSLAVPVSSALVLPAPSLQSHERVFSMAEENEVVNGKHRRVQSIQVQRDGRLLEFKRDLGPADDFLGINELLVFSLFEDEVQEVMEWAEAHREINAVQPFLEEVAANSTLVEDAVRLEEQKQKLRQQNHRTLRKDSN